MPKIKFKDKGFAVEVYKGCSVLDAALDHRVPIYHTCGGNASCSTCRVVVLKGAENLSPKETAEAQVLDDSGRPEIEMLLNELQNLVIFRIATGDDPFSSFYEACRLNQGNEKSLPIFTGDVAVELVSGQHFIKFLGHSGGQQNLPDVTSFPKCFAT